jgi:hypothetical protein
MSGWKAMVKRPMTEDNLYELLGEMLIAKVTWKEAEAAFKEVLDNDPRYKNGREGQAAKAIHDLEFTMRFRHWLDKDDPPKKKA